MLKLGPWMIGKLAQLNKLCKKLVYVIPPIRFEPSKPEYVFFILRGLDFIKIKILVYEVTGDVAAYISEHMTLSALG